MGNFVVALVGIREAYGSKRIKRTDNRFRHFMSVFYKLKENCSELAQFIANLFLVPEPENRNAAPGEGAANDKNRKTSCLNLSYFPDNLKQKKQQQVREWSRGRRRNWQSEDDLVMQFMVRDLTVEELALIHDQMSEAGDDVTKTRLSEIIRLKKSKNDIALFFRAITARGLVETNTTSTATCTTDINSKAQRQQPDDEEVIETAKFLLSSRQSSYMPASWVWLWNEMVQSGEIDGNIVDEHYPRPDNLYDALGDILDPESERVML